VSVPSAKLTSPRGTATAEPELEPPGTMRASNGFVGTGNRVRTPTRPVANWSRFGLADKDGAGRKEALDGRSGGARQIGELRAGGEDRKPPYSRAEPSHTRMQS